MTARADSIFVACCCALTGIGVAVAMFLGMEKRARAIAGAVGPR